MTPIDNVQLAAIASSTAQRCKDGVAWVTTPTNAARVGDPTALVYRLDQYALRARRYARAASRKMCVAVFGPSQAGKSYLISVLASPRGGRLATEMDGTSYDFLADLNPMGGRESTGLVTRMTTDPSRAPKGYPVTLRLLSQTDLVKILANTFHSDLDLNHFKVEVPDANTISKRIDELRPLAKPRATDVLTGDDVFDLWDYLENHFSQQAGRKSRFTDDFWRDAIRIAPRLDGPDRARLWSLLWYDYQPFTDLYLKMFESLRKLGFQTEAFAEIGALTPRNTSIIDVSVLDKLGSPNEAELRLLPMGGNQAVSLPRSLAAALTAELCITVKEKPSEVFDYTDLLDFPGARSRLQIKRLEDAGKDERGETSVNPLRELLLRGKVAYLFEGYAAEGEISALVLCVPDSVQEVRGLSNMVEEWVGDTLGKLPEARAKEKCGLFLVLTKMDHEFEQKEGVKDEEKDWGIRIESSLLKNFRGDWPTNWDNRPFRNLFWLRNPTIHDNRVMTYDANKREVGLAAPFVQRHQVLHDRFVSNKLVREHFENPEEAWKEAFQPGDGGVSYLVRKLTPICDRETKSAQTRNRLAEVRVDVVRELERFHVAGDMQARVDQRLEVGDRIMARLYDQENPTRLGSLLRRMQVDGGDLASYLYTAFVHGIVDGEGQAAADSPAMSTVPTSPRRGAAPPQRRGAATQDAQRPAPDTGQAPPARATWERRAAQQVLRCWERSMAATADDAQLARDLHIGRDLMSEISAEMLAMARRTNLQGAIEKAITRIAVTEQSEQRIAKAAIIGERFVNRAVSEMGYVDMPADKRPTVKVNGTTRPVFAKRDTVYGIENWQTGAPDFFEQFFDDWANAFYQLIEDNAKSLAGLTVDLEQNNRLGQILADLRKPA